MTAYPHLFLIGVAWAFLGGVAFAQSDVTILKPTASSSGSTQVAATAPDGTPVVHKSSHKKKKSKVAKTASTTSTQTAANDGTPPATPDASSQKKTATTADVPKKTATQAPVTPSTPAPVTAPSKTVASTPIPAAKPPVAPSPAPIKPTPAPASVVVNLPANAPPSASVPAVETGLPIARKGATGIVSPTGEYRPPIASTLTPLTPGLPPTTPPPVTATPHTTAPVDNFTFINFDKRKTRTYPWKREIITTVFWIGEGGSTISPTDNIDSAWIKDWVSSNHGTDTPTDRSGYAPATHAPTVNPFYVALPFNDLAYPDKARRWLPDGWHRAPKDGKQVSACKDRWVEIKNEQGDTCFAQWEDVGPLRSDHAEYVFGPERPDTYTRAGLDVSPAVANYLNITGKNHLTSWRFVDEEDVPPGYWLKYDEQAVLYSALHELKNKPVSKSIQQESAPSVDDGTVDSNRKRVAGAKG